MNLKLDYSIGNLYKSPLQQMRVITETWASQNLFCPVCGNSSILHFTANRPVADFQCENCSAQFELKSKKAVRDCLHGIIPDGAYHTMISRIKSNENPHFFFLFHNSEEIQKLFFVPNYFFTPDCIIQRKPLSDNARRKGWTGCNINLSAIPDLGKIIIAGNGTHKKDDVVRQVRETLGLQVRSISGRGWLFDVLQCVEEIPFDEFDLQTLYSFSDKLEKIHSENHNIQAKIRQQIQYLRDKGFVEFLGGGLYRKNHILKHDTIIP